MSNTKVAIIGSVGVPAKYGGFETLADFLVQHLSHQLDITVYCSGLQYTRKIKKYKQAKIEYINLNANGVQSIAYDIISILRACRNNDILLILGVAGSLVLPLVKWFTRVKTIVHIDGMEWKREKWKYYAKKYLQFSEKIALGVADLIIADNDAILKNIDNKYHPKTVMIAYGSDHAKANALEDRLLSKLEIEPKPYIFSVCRIVPENNIKTIIKACIKAKTYLVIVGNWYHSDYGLSLWQEFHENPYIKMVNPLYNQNELDALRSNCNFYVHGHSAGGTNPSLVEAMRLGLRIVAFDVDFNRYTLGRKGLFFKDESSLVKHIENNEYDEGLRTYHLKFSEANYSWDNISQQYLNLFNKL